MAEKKAKTVKEVTQQFKFKDVKKHSCLFESTDTKPVFTSVYLMRDAAKQFLGIDDLDKVTAIEVTVRVV